MQRSMLGVGGFLAAGMAMAVTVRMQEPLPGDWEIVQETQKSTKESSRLAAWNVEVPAGGAAVLEYTARVRW